MEFGSAVEASFVVEGRGIASAKTYAIAPSDLRQYVNPEQADVFQPTEKTLPAAPVFQWRFPAGSVTAVELLCS
jgi:hypothetical protein